MSLYSLVHNNTDSIVQQTLSKYDRVEFGVHFVLVEYGQDRYGIRRG